MSTGQRKSQKEIDKLVEYHVFKSMDWLIHAEIALNKTTPDIARARSAYAKRFYHELYFWFLRHNKKTPTSEDKVFMVKAANRSAKEQLKNDGFL